MIISGLGVSLIIQTAVLLLLGARFKLIETGRLIPNSWYFTISDIRISFTRVLVVVVALVLMVGLDYFVRKTRWGKATRATAQDIEAAAFMGVDVDRIVSLVYVLGSALAGVGGVLLGLLYTQVDFTFGFFIGLKAFTAAVIGGIGSIRGALLGGLVLGVAESFAAGLISPTHKDVTTFILLAGVLLLRPTGILGSPLRIRETLTTRPVQRRRPLTTLHRGASRRAEGSDRLRSDPARPAHGARRSADPRGAAAFGSGRISSGSARRSGLRSSWWRA